MRHTQTCPKCSGKRFAVVNELRRPGQAMNVVEPVPAVTVSMKDEPGRSLSGRHCVGHLEVWICLGCSYTELYAGGLAAIEQLAAEYPNQVHIVDTTPQRGPFR